MRIFPAFQSPDSANSSLSHRESLCQLGLSFVHNIRSYKFNFFIGKFCSIGAAAMCCLIGLSLGPVIISEWNSVFFTTIVAIVIVGSNPKMRRRYARWVVARVADKHSFWNWAFVYNIRKPTCSPKLWPDAHLSISSRAGCANPYPETIGFFNFFPESLGLFFRKLDTCTSSIKCFFRFIHNYSMFGFSRARWSLTVLCASFILLPPKEGK